jgi:hypothetical protein
MSEIIADLPDPGCFLLHSGSGIEENQRLNPDLFSCRAPAREGRDRGGRFAKGHSGNPQGRPRGIANPKRRAIGLQAWRQNREAALAVAKRRPWLLRPLLLALLPPRVSARDPAERIGVRPEAVQTPEDAGRVLSEVWEAVGRGEIGTAEAAHIARRVRGRLRLQRRCSRIKQRAAAE